MKNAIIAKGGVPYGEEGSSPEGGRAERDLGIDPNYRFLAEEGEVD